jgi:hypothetical protein
MVLSLPKDHLLAHRSSARSEGGATPQ